MKNQQLNNQKTERKKLPSSRALDTTAKVHITDKFIKQLYVTHSHVPKDIEWCGFLVYKVISGSLSDINNFKFEILGFLPIDIGTSGYTDAKVSDHIIDVHEEFPEILESGIGNNPIVKTGFIHTHHSMNAFFSATDMDELLSNAMFHNYYLSVIVNYRGDIIGKVGIPVKSKTNSVTSIEEIIKNDLGEDIVLKNTVKSDKEEDLILTIDCEFTYGNLGDIFENKINSLVKEYNTRKAKANIKNHQIGFNQSRHNYNNPKNLFDDVDLKDFKTVTPKDIKISDGTLDILVTKLIYNDLKLTQKYSDNREDLKKLIEMQSLEESMFIIDLIEENFEENIKTLFKADNDKPNFIKRVYLLLEYFRTYVKKLDDILEVESTLLDLLEDLYWDLTENVDNENFLIDNTLIKM